MADRIRIVDHLWVPLPDGRRLAARAWRPAGQGPWPGILEYLPYRKRDGTAPRDAGTHPVFAAHGFACLRVDIAGTGDSDGAFDDEYSQQELSDGEAVLDWMAEQPWCTGRVGIVGISWGGFNGLQLAARRPPALGAVVTVCSTVDRFADDIHYMGGCLLTDNFNWGAQMTAYNTRPPDPALREDWRARWLERLEGTPFLAAEWLRHPARDAYWRRGSVCEDWSAIEVPVLAIGGWADAYLNAPLALVENLPVPARALIGPWDHKYPHIARVGPAADFPGEAVRWFGHWLDGRPTGAERLPAVRAYLQEHDAPSPRLKPRRGAWVAEAAWPSPALAGEVLHLHEGALAPGPGAGTAEVDTPLTLGAAAAYFCPGMRIDHELAGDQAADDALSLCFDTAPLAAPLALLGRPVLELAFSVDRPVAQLCARLCDVAPDGVSQRISYRPRNLCAHAGFAAPERLVPGRLYRTEIPLNACGHALAPGHRLRLALSTSYWPVLWPAPERARVRLDLAGCRLHLPVRRGAAGQGAAGQGAAGQGAPDPVRPAPPPDVTEFGTSRAESRRFVDETGRLVLETADDFGGWRGAHGLGIANSVAQRFEIRPDDPLSAVHRAEWDYRLDRD
ncbi:CocE/NonD family hydrolase, partial [Paralimibaculum aggregatum]|uniref:CocE/NonD family hydrolase n=1 Tax=Paralimibaculum aggregatum TaxID=3036245 RepID=UPI0025547D9A